MNLLSFNQEVAATTEKLYVVKQGNFDLTDGMSKYEADMYVLENECRLANLEVVEL